MASAPCAIAETGHTFASTFESKVESPQAWFKGDFSPTAASLLPTVSGGPGSLLPFASLDPDSQRFLAQATPSAAISTVMGDGPGKNPVRVAAGLHHASTAAERVRLTIEEAKRLHAFDRKLLVLQGQAGKTVDGVPINAAEFFSHGDVATLTVQYSNQSSLVSILEGGTRQGAHTFEALLRGVNEELANRGKKGLSVPRVVIYGESLGAWTPQDALLNDSEASLFKPGGPHAFDAALFSGTPGFSKLRMDWLGDGHTGQHGAARQLANRQELANAQGLDKARVFFLNHPDDPVTRVAWNLLWHKPADWPKRRWWAPGLAFAWEVLKVPFAIKKSLAGSFGDRQHDYSLDLPAFVRKAYGFDAVSDAQLARVIQALQGAQVKSTESLP